MSVYEVRERERGRARESERERLVAQTLDDHSQTTSFLSTPAYGGFPNGLCLDPGAGDKMDSRAEIQLGD